jgi:hypothetical protein
MLVWILLALITSQIQEWVASIFKWRASMLESSIRGMLQNPDLAKKFYDHPLIKSLYSNSGARKPSYIPDSKFALVLFDLVMEAGSEDSEIRQMETGFEKLRASLATIQAVYPDVGKSLNTLIFGLEEKLNQSEAAAAEARHRVEGWFNDAMDRLSGAYRRKIQLYAIIIGLALAVLLNADSVAIVNKLWNDPLVRDIVAKQAEAVQAVPQGEQPDPAKVAEYVGQLQSLSIPLGWEAENMPVDGTGWLMKFVGLLLSGIAAAQGAPFWFDLMKKVLNARSSFSVSPPPATTEQPQGVG